MFVCSYISSLWWTGDLSSLSPNVNVALWISGIKFNGHYCGATTCCSNLLQWEEKKKKLKVKWVWAWGDILYSSVRNRSEMMTQPLLRDTTVSWQVYCSVSKDAWRQVSFCLFELFFEIAQHLLVYTVHTCMLSRGWIVITFLSQLFLLYHVNVQVNNSHVGLPA